MKENNSGNILFLAASFKNWVCDTLYQEQLAISLRLPNAIFYGPGYRYRSNYVPQIISELYGASAPEAIFCYIDERRLLGEPLAEQIRNQYNVPPELHVFPKGLAEIKLPKFAWINDFWHCSKEEWDKILLGNGFDFAFSTYCPPFTSCSVFESFFSQKVRERVRFIPWPRSINPRILPGNTAIQKEHDISLLGAMSPHFYPLRCQMLETFKNMPQLKVFHSQHPGYRYFIEGEAMMGDIYFQTLAQSKIFASCTGKYNIPFIKLYEVLASATALMCDKPCGGELLGLVNDRTYIEVTKENFVTRARQYLESPEELQEIFQLARETYLTRHTTDIRAKEFALTIKALLDGREEDTWMKYSPAKPVNKIAPAISTESGGPCLFRNESQVYLANADRWDLTKKNLETLKSFELEDIDTYASVIGGFSGLNYLLLVNPQKIVFFDVNTYMIDYAQVIIELIRISSSPEDFISRAFGRSLSAFSAKLNVENQNEFLAIPVNNAIVNDTLTKLSESAAETFKHTLLHSINGTIPPGPRNCKRLLPCWPENERVPVGGGEEKGYDERGQLQPNTNSFFYGLGWLKDLSSFQRIQQLLTSRPIKYTAFDLLDDSFDNIAEPKEKVAINISNIDDWFPEATQKRIEEQTQKIVSNCGLWAWITSHNSIKVSQLNPHYHALLAMLPQLRGHIVEVTHKTPWGFNEFPRENILYQDYLVKPCAADTIILHILIGEGLGAPIFSQVLAKAYQECANILILEHERNSIDWQGKNTAQLISKDELAQLIFQITACRKEQLRFGYIRGERDAKRNMLFVLAK
ncbi:MAG: glycosyltransferase family 1 protein [Deltaproteobacteria bacterium]|nr:glycosyltransferase family 1 protein [Deltaproteobacteria bacterium]